MRVFWVGHFDFDFFFVMLHSHENQSKFIWENGWVEILMFFLVSRKFLAICNIMFYSLCIPSHTVHVRIIYNVGLTSGLAYSVLHNHNISLLLANKYDNYKSLWIEIIWLHYFIVDILKVLCGYENDKKEYSFKKNLTPYWWIMSWCNHRHTLIILKYFWLKNTSCTWVSPLFLSLPKLLLRQLFPC